MILTPRKMSDFELVKNQDKMTNSWLNKSRSSSGLESSIEALTIESKMILVYIIINCIILIIALTAIIIYGCWINRDGKTRSKRYCEGCGNKTRILEVSKDVKCVSLEIQKPTSKKCERQITVWTQFRNTNPNLNRSQSSSLWYYSFLFNSDICEDNMRT